MNAKAEFHKPDFSFCQWQTILFLCETWCKFHIKHGHFYLYNIFNFFTHFVKIMKISIIYSSVTGNTEKLARGIRAIFSHNTHISPIEQAPSFHEADLYLLDFWVPRGAPDSRMAKYMQSLQGQHI